MASVIYDVLNATKTEDEARPIAEQAARIAETLDRQYPQFNRDRFLRLCGM